MDDPENMSMVHSNVKDHPIRNKRIILCGKNHSPFAGLSNESANFLGLLRKALINVMLCKIAIFENHGSTIGQEIERC